jgi:hypothetical protein
MNIKNYSLINEKFIGGLFEKCHRKGEKHDEFPGGIRYLLG